jgi:hypothetical protein
MIAVRHSDHCFFVDQCYWHDAAHCSGWQKFFASTTTTGREQQCKSFLGHHAAERFVPENVKCPRP